MKSSTNNAVWASGVFSQGEAENAWSEYAVELITNKSENYIVAANTRYFTSYTTGLETKSLLVDYGANTLLEKNCVVSTTQSNDYSPHGAPVIVTTGALTSTKPLRVCHVSLDGKHVYAKDWKNTFNSFGYDANSWYGATSFNHYYTDVPYSTNSYHYVYIDSISTANAIGDIHVTHDGKYVYVTETGNTSFYVKQYELTTPYNLSTASNEKIISFTYHPEVYQVSTLTYARSTGITMSRDGKKSILFSAIGNSSSISTKTYINQHIIPFDITNINTSNIENILYHGMSLSSDITANNRTISGISLTSNPDCTELLFAPCARGANISAISTTVSTYSSPSFATIGLSNTINISGAMVAGTTGLSLHAALSQDGSRLYTFSTNTTAGRYSVSLTKGNHALTYQLNTFMPGTVRGVYEKKDIKVSTAFVENEFKTSDTYTYGTTFSGTTLTLPFNNNVANIVHVNDNLSFITQNEVERYSLTVNENTISGATTYSDMVIGNDNRFYTVRKYSSIAVINVHDVNTMLFTGYANLSLVYTSSDDTILLTKEAGVIFNYSGSMYYSTRLDGNRSVNYESYISNDLNSTFCFSQNGLNMLILKANLSLEKRLCNDPWVNVSSSVAQTYVGPLPADTMKMELGDGGKILFLGRSDRIDVYTMSSALDLSTLTYSSNIQLNISSGKFSFNNDRTKVIYESGGLLYRIADVSKTFQLSNVATITANVLSVSGSNNEIAELDVNIPNDTYLIEIGVTGAQTFIYANSNFIGYEKSGDNHLYRTDWNVLDGDKRALKFKIEAGEASVDANSVAINLKRKI